VGDLIDRQYVEAVRIELGYRMYQHELLPNGKREPVYRRTLAAMRSILTLSRWSIARRSARRGCMLKDKWCVWPTNA
jgi:hypothetical protein